MERRRQELMGDENGYWRRRMEAEARAAEAAAAVSRAEEDDVVRAEVRRGRRRGCWVWRESEEGMLGVERMCGDEVCGACFSGAG